MGRRTDRIDTGSSTASNSFGYNIRSELTSAAMGINNYSFIFDQIGNRLSASNNVDEWTYLCNVLNQYTNITDGVTISPSYDHDGNMTLAPLPSLGGPLLASTLGWNGENRMISASNTAMVASYNYDYQGRRFEKTVVTNSVTNTTQFVYDGWNLVAELSTVNSQQSTNLYVWGLDLSGTLQGAGGIGGLLCVSVDSVVYFPCCDANGNITDYVDTNGVVVAHREFDPFGNTVVATGAKVNDFHFWFSSKYLDAESGLYYYGYRFYSPELARWISRDPIEETGSLQSRRGGRSNDYRMRSRRTSSEPTYSYLQNEPLSKYDPLGLMAGGGCSRCSSPIPSPAPNQDPCVEAEKMLRLKGKIGDEVAGNLICHEGKMLPCVWNKTPDLFKNLPGIRICLQVHENTHAEQHEGERCKPCGTYVVESATTSQHDKNECAAYRMELECLLAQYVDECGMDYDPKKKSGDMSLCETGYEAAIHNAWNYMIKYCKGDFPKW